MFFRFKNFFSHKISHQDDNSTVNVVDRRVYYYHHIPKTGGNSLHRILADCFAVSTIFSSYEDFPNSSIIPDGTNLIVGGHWGEFGRMQTAIESTPITFLRDPLTRYLSEYNFLVQEANRKNVKLSPLQKLITLQSFKNAITLYPDYFSDYQTRFLGGDFLLQNPWINQSESYRENIFNHAKQIIDLSLIGISERYEQSIYFLTSNFGILPSVGYNERDNVTSAPIFKKSDFDTEQIEFLKNINFFDNKLYEYAIAKLDRLGIKEGLPLDEKNYRLHLGRTSKGVPRISGNYFFNLFNPFLADGISSREMFEQRPGFWIVESGKFIFWIKLLNKKSKLFIRFYLAKNPPVSVDVNGTTINFQLNVIHSDSECQGFVVFELAGGSEDVCEIVIQFPPGTVRNESDKRLLSAMITQISVYECVEK